jgi:hypothetical protein
VLNQFLAKEKNDEDTEEINESFNKTEIENAIQKLKNIQVNL